MIDPEFKHRFTVDPDLADRYSWRSDDKQLANDIAAAKRAATTMTNMAKSFQYVLGPEQQLSINAAASSLARLVANLQALRPLFKAYRPWKAAKEQRAEEARLDARAAERWASPAEVLAEAQDMVDFHYPAEGADAVEALEAFLLRINPGAKKISRNCSGSYRLEGVRNSLARGSSVDAGRALIQILDSMGSGHMGYSENWFPGRADYEAWRNARRSAHAFTTGALSAILAKARE
jgi:hypothetical protein